MVYDVIPTERFEKDVKYYKRKKKFTHIMDDISGIIQELQNGNLLGDEINDLGLMENESTFKVRAVNTDTKAGQSNGYRLIYYAVKNDHEIYLLTIYYKKDLENIDKKQILKMIESILV